ncbi:MAG: lipid A biosynthesis lauroyl acyltransferase [Methylobacteriaceae bacterium]|nr:lipid A biosynthesis lauroyl acyltransferase [Methylobacteriaceae bacterium]
MAASKQNLGSKLLETLVVFGVRLVFLIERGLGRTVSSAIGGALLRVFGRFVAADSTMKRNLENVFPEKSREARESLARGAWDNLGRVGAEYAHLDTMVDIDSTHLTGAIVELVGAEHFFAVRDDGRPGLFFSGHLGNWELLSVCAHRLGLNLISVFRAPNDPGIARIIHEIRGRTMGSLQAAGAGAAQKMVDALESGAHLGMLIDQHLGKGVPVEFMGRPALANPTLAKLARRFDCPVHGARVIRLPHGRFRIEVTPPMRFDRDADGHIDVVKATQLMTSTIDAWVREYPDQWLWMHRRWRVPTP